MMTNTKTLLEVLRRHYIKPSSTMDGGVFIPECGINGPGQQRRADALYVGFTSTSGRLLVGHELKVSRADWQHELDKVGKADFWADACHQWWVVAPGPEVVPVEEVPNGWGLLYPGARMRMKVAKPAHIKDPTTHVPPWDAVRSIMARVDTLNIARMRDRSQGETERIAQAVARERERAAEAASEGQLTEGQRNRLRWLEQLERQLGEQIVSRWDAESGDLTPELAANIVRIARSVKLTGVEDLHNIEYAEDRLRDGAQALLDGLAEFAAARAALLSIADAPKGRR